MEQGPKAVAGDSDQDGRQACGAKGQGGRNLIRINGGCYSSSETSEKQTKVHRDVYNFVGEQGCEKLGEIVFNGLILHEEVEARSSAEKEVGLSFKRVGGGHASNWPPSLLKFRFKFVSIH